MADKIVALRTSLVYNLTRPKVYQGDLPFDWKTDNFDQRRKNFTVKRTKSF